jgi:uncharacterized membrane protein YjdF
VRVAAGTGEAAEFFLGTQDDIWDSQSDMFFARLGKNHNTCLENCPNRETKK